MVTKDKISVAIDKAILAWAKKYVRSKEQRSNLSHLVEELLYQKMKREMRGRVA